MVLEFELAECVKDTVQEVPSPCSKDGCAHFVLNSTSLQPIPAYASQSSGFAQTLVGVGYSEPEWVGVG